MSFNNSRNYNIRNNSRFTRPTKFIPASSTNHQNFEVQSIPEPQEPQPPTRQVLVQDEFKQEDAEMRPVQEAPAGGEGPANGTRLPFFKTKLAGVKKISNRERRRRQNALLRRLTSPKNALMCINEMLPNEQIANQFKVEPAPQDSMYYSHGSHNFCAELAIDGVTYKGYGENKLSARNAAAEQAIRDIVLKKMERYTEMMAAHSAGADGNDGGEQGAEAGEEDAEALPMIQLLSFALHKLFAEWEGAGHHVPQLRASKNTQVSGEEEPAPPAPAAKKPRKVPDNAASMHPAMLLTILRPQATYRELTATGEKPQQMIFTMAVDIDDKTFIGKAPSKKEARKAAARAACKVILGITFDDESYDSIATHNSN